jgi:RimJ/RimL family protein N-acetyltransferase
VTLRLLSGADQDEFLGLAAAGADLHNPWMSLPATPQEFQAYLTRFDHVTTEGLLVCLRRTGTMAGLVNINSIIRGRFQNGSLAYSAFAPTAGQGYMAEGLGLVLRYASALSPPARIRACLRAEAGHRPPTSRAASARIPSTVRFASATNPRFVSG